MKTKDLVSVADLSPKDIRRLLHKALAFKREGTKPLLLGRTIALVFQKPSNRTRVSFEVGMYQLGGHTVYLSQLDVGMGNREHPADVARVLSRYVDGIVARTFAQQDVELLAQYASVPVINGLSDEEHPCQALADLLTIYEKKGTLEGLTIAYLGDGNNVARSLALACASIGVSFHMASPPGYELPPQVRQRLARGSSDAARVLYASSPAQAVKDADVVYTDVWVSMGQEEQGARRKMAFVGYQVSPQLMSQAKPGALFMHPLPAHRGEEVTPEMLEHPSSVVFDQAENRLHIQKAILTELLGKRGA